MKALQFSINTPKWLLLKALGMLNQRIYYRGPLPTIRLVDIPEPVLPSGKWLKVRTRMCGFCASDLNLILLRDSPSASPFTSFPCVFGHETCGDVIEVGSEVNGISVGDYVTIAPHLNCTARNITNPCEPCRSGRLSQCENLAEGDISPGLFNGICADIGGSFAPIALAHESQIFKLDAGMQPETGVMIEPMAVALQAVLDSKPQDNEHILVIGGGVIGSLVVQAIRALGIGCRITVSEPSPFHAELCRNFGADDIIADGDLLKHACRLTSAVSYKPLIGPEILMGGFNRIFDAVGNTATLNSGMRSLAAEGTLSVLGIGHDVKLDLTPLWLKLQTIRGVFAYGFMEYGGESRHLFNIVIDLIRQKKIRLTEMVTHAFPLNQYRRMIDINLNKCRHGAIKTAVTFL